VGIYLRVMKGTAPKVEAFFEFWTRAVRSDVGKLNYRFVIS
jgi:hypothetical protein